MDFFYIIRKLLLRWYQLYWTWGYGSDVSLPYNTQYRRMHVKSDVTKIQIETDILLTSTRGPVLLAVAVSRLNRTCGVLIAAFIVRKYQQAFVRTSYCDASWYRIKIDYPYQKTNIIRTSCTCNTAYQNGQTYQCDKANCMTSSLKSISINYAMQNLMNSSLCVLSANTWTNNWKFNGKRKLYLYNL